MELKHIPKLKHIESNSFFLIAGPCAIEGEEMANIIAEKIVEITNKLEIPFIFKGSFKKANRSRLDSFTGIGDEKALNILKNISDKFNIPTLTDIHKISDAVLASKYVDVLQIPAFLARQTDLLIAAAKTGKTVNIKKGQFMSPETMQHAVKKIIDSGIMSDRVLPTHGWALDCQNLLSKEASSPPEAAIETQPPGIRKSLPVSETVVCDLLSCRSTRSCVTQTRLGNL